MPSNPPILECCGHDTYHEFIISFINHTLFSCQFDEGLVAYRLAHGTLDDDTVQIVLGSTRDYISNLCTWSITLPIFASSDLLPRLFGQLILSAPQHSSVMELVESLKIVNVGILWFEKWREDIHSLIFIRKLKTLFVSSSDLFHKHKEEARSVRRSVLSEGWEDRIETEQFVPREHFRNDLHLDTLRSFVSHIGWNFSYF